MRTANCGYGPSGRTAGGRLSLWFRTFSGELLSSSATQHLLDWLVDRPTRLRPDPSLISFAEWDALIAASIAHTVAPQLFQRLSNKSRAVPPRVLKCSFVAMVWQKQQMSHFERDLSVVLQALNAEDISPILLKGAHLANMIYSSPSHRPMHDLDLLVRHDQTEIAIGALQNAGYTPEYSKSFVDLSERTRELRMFKEGSFLVELHWSIADPRDPVSIDLDGMWQRSREVLLFGQRARVLSVEDLLLHICFHAGVSHQFDQKGLRPIFDVRAITERFGESLDWRALGSRAHEWGIERSTYLMLELARIHGKAKVPENVLSKLKPVKVSYAVYEAARAQMFEAPGPRISVAPRSIALAWVNPRSMWHHLFAPQNLQQPTIRGQMQTYVSNYLRFAWHCLRRDRQRFVLIIKSIRRHLVLSKWLAQKQSGTKP